MLTNAPTCALRGCLQARPHDRGSEGTAARRRYEIVRDFLKAAEKVWGEAWGSVSHMVTRPVTIKAMLRVAFDLAAADAEPVDGRLARWMRRLAPWSQLGRELRTEGFYECFCQCRLLRERSVEHACSVRVHPPATAESTRCAEIAQSYVLADPRTPGHGPRWRRRQGGNNPLRKPRQQAQACSSPTQGEGACCRVSLCNLVPSGFLLSRTTPLASSVVSAAPSSAHHRGGPAPGTLAARRGVGHAGLVDATFRSETTLRVQAARDGNREALERLLADHLAFARQVAALRLGERLAGLEAAEDVAQDAVVNALLRSEKLPCDTRASFRAWLARVVENALCDANRRHGALKRAGRSPLPIHELDSHVACNLLLGNRVGASPSQMLGAKELAARLDAALGRLGERQRKAVVMHRVEGASYAEIARELGFGSESSARSLVARALSRLSDLLD